MVLFVGRVVDCKRDISYPKNYEHCAATPQASGPEAGCASACTRIPFAECVVLLALWLAACKPISAK
jgi:hypothetical protein